MHWTAIKLHLLPLIMQEIEVCEKDYIDLINKIKLKKTKELIDKYFDFHLIQKNNFEFQGFSKNLKQNNIKQVDRATLRATLRNNKAQGNLRKSAINGGRESNINALNRKTMGIKGGEIQEPLEEENDDNFGDNIITKKLRIRLTDEEYRLLQKLKAKRNHAQ